MKLLGKIEFKDWIENGCHEIIDDDIRVDLSNSVRLHRIPESLVKLHSISSLFMHKNLIMKIPEFFCNLTNLTILDLSNNLIKIIPDSFSKLTNLTYLDLSLNLINSVPESLSELKNLNDLILSRNKLCPFPKVLTTLVNLRTLDLSHNYIGYIPYSISKLINLTHLYLSHNRIYGIPDSISDLVNLTHLYLSYNRIYDIPVSISNLANLAELDVSYNDIKQIPYKLIYLKRLRRFSYISNPVENIHPNIQTFLDRIKTKIEYAYNDTQSVHKSSIQKSVKISIQNILSVKYDTEEDILSVVKKDNILSQDCKNSLISYAQDLTPHSFLQVNFLDVLRAVWNRIRQNKYADEIKKVLNIEIMDAQDKCFTGRLSRLVNCLSGFDDLVEINLTDNERIGSVISQIKSQLKDENRYSRERHIELSRDRLLDLGYSQDTIDEWTIHIMNE